MQQSRAPEAFGLYLVITNPVAGYEACTEAAVAAGLRYVQLRMKERPGHEVLEVGRRMAAITRGSDTELIINDDVSVAVAVDAAGVHLGQDDMTLSEARRLWPAGRGKRFGLSTHNESQAASAEAQAPDYIGVGPVLPTPTKRIPDPVLGIERAARIVRQSRLTCVAIGGIDDASLPAVLAAGITNFAVVRYVCASMHPRERIRRLMDLWHDRSSCASSSRPFR